MSDNENNDKMFATHSSMEELYQKAQARLPITTVNQLITILMEANNTIRSLIRRERNATSNKDLEKSN